LQRRVDEATKFIPLDRLRFRRSKLDGWFDPETRSGNDVVTDQAAVSR
jgi:hypothetical protein